MERRGGIWSGKRLLRILGRLSTFSLHLIDPVVAREGGQRVDHSPVAQLVEQVAVNHPVAGSSPAGGALLPQASHSACKTITESRGFDASAFFVLWAVFCSLLEDGGLQRTLSVFL